MKGNIHRYILSTIARLVLFPSVIGLLSICLKFPPAHLYHGLFKYFSTYIPERMIEMDQFVWTLSGRRSEIITRQSQHSGATMKKKAGTIEKLDFSQ